MRRFTRIAVGVVPVAALATPLLAMRARAQTDTTSSSKNTTLKLISSFEKVGESPLAQPQYDDGVQMAIKDLKKKGITVDFERIPGSGVAVAPAETAFLAAEAKNPDVWLGLTASQLFAISPKVVASGIPTFAFASPGAGIKSGSQGGDNIFLVRPLNDSTAQKLTEYACKEQKLKKIGILAVNLPFGTDSTELAKEEAAKYKGCEIVTTQTNGFADTDLTQQVLAFKDAGVDGIVAFDYPNPFGVFVKQMQDNGLTIPILGGASLGLAVDSKAITDASKLVIIDDCVPVAREVEDGEDLRQGVREGVRLHAQLRVGPGIRRGDAGGGSGQEGRARSCGDPEGDRRDHAESRVRVQERQEQRPRQQRDPVQVQPRRFPQAAEEVPAGVHPRRRRCRVP